MKKLLVEDIAEPGWYWVRVDGQVLPAEIQKFNTPDEWLYCSNGIGCCSLSKLYGQMAIGPIPEPHDGDL